MTAVEFPPMQKGASFNLDAVKAKIEAARAAVARVRSPHRSTGSHGGRPSHSRPLFCPRLAQAVWKGVGMSTIVSGTLASAIVEYRSEQNRLPDRSPGAFVGIDLNARCPSA